jgi:pimeloyl-ACP methyl ester carboxylesterase
LIQTPAWIEGKREGAPVPGRLPIVLLHGIGGGKAQWTPQLAALSAGGWRAVAWAMPGYGESAPPADPYTFETLAAALVRLFDALDAAKAIVVGHSMGGMLALQASAQFPERIGALVLSCTSAAFGSPDGAFQRQFLLDRVAPLDAGRGMADVAAQQVPRMMSPSAAQPAREQAMAIMSAVPEATYRAALRCLVTFDRRDALALVSVPTLVLAAAADPVAPPAVMERMAERIPGAEFDMLGECGHLANLERPAAFSGALLDFADRRCR